MPVYEEGEAGVKYRRWYLLMTVAILVLVALYAYPATARLEPEQPQRYSLYIVKPGDTLQTIAGKVMPGNKDAVKVLEELNGLEPGQELYPGDILNIPDPEGELSEPLGPSYSSLEAANEANRVMEKAMREAARVKRYQIENSRGVKSREMVLEITAYSKDDPGMDGRGIMFTGLPVDKGALAVDPRVIPLGSVVWIPGVGYTVALDTGGAIKGRRADLYIPDRAKALEWGRKTVKVRVLE